MCGIAAIVGLNGFVPQRTSLEAMAAALVHRGPDDEGFYADGAVGFGFRRLSILDLTADGHQPMLSADGQLAIIFNGEIYNYVELREELCRLGYRFRSTGDTEVLLAAYRHWGAACLDRLNGMWAFIIHDRRTNTVFGSRDRFGVKPLFVYRSPQAVVMASEIKAIRRSGLYRTAVDWGTASRYLVLGALDDSDHTFFEGITKLPAGSYFVIDAAGRMTVRTFWQITAGEPPADAAARFAELFEDSVALRLRSDVPVGVCLSGGLDSTSIVCAMARQRQAAGAAPLLAFSFNTTEFDESRFLRATIEQSGSTLVPLNLGGQELFDRMPEVLAAQDEPMPSMTPVVLHQLMKLAREHGVTVLLNGDGADEYLAGYPTYFRDYWFTLLRGGRWGTVRREVQAFAQAHGADAGQHTRALLRHAAFQLLSHVPLYRPLARAARRRTLQRSSWYQGALTGALRLFQARQPASLDEALSDSVRKNPLPLYLRLVDRNSMAHSVEAREVFLDYRLVSLAFSLPPDLKLRGPWNKFVLREAMKGRIPEVVRTRVEKFGFPTPVRTWIASFLYEPLRDLLGSKRAQERGIYKVDGILRDLERVRHGASDMANPLIRVAQFELWSQGLENGGSDAVLTRTG